MIRMSMIVVALCAIAVGLVQIRRAETSVRHDVQRMEIRRVAVQRKLWDQQVRLNEQMAPERVRHRAVQMALELRDFNPPPMHYALAAPESPNTE